MFNSLTPERSDFIPILVLIAEVIFKNNPRCKSLNFTDKQTFAQLMVWYCQVAWCLLSQTTAQANTFLSSKSVVAKPNGVFELLNLKLHLPASELMVSLLGKDYNSVFGHYLEETQRDVMDLNIN